MVVSDFIVRYLIENGITDVFGYPGGMVTYLMDSFRRYSGEITSHVTYHEQAAAFAACGYAQESRKVGVAYATSGPGATNLLTGICNAFFDSIPVLFITGQVNSFELKGDKRIRQRGFQETDIVSMVSGVTKYAVMVDDAKKIKWYLDYAFSCALGGRKGPVLLDIPMDLLRTEIDVEKLISFENRGLQNNALQEEDLKKIKYALKHAKRPVILLGNGVKLAGAVGLARDVVNQLAMPVVSTMISFDIILDEELNYGFIGAYGHRSANFIVAKSDLMIVLGSRMDIRQVGAQRDRFAPSARIIRIDIDQGELAYKVHDNEIPIQANIISVLNGLRDIAQELDCDYGSWIKVCKEVRTALGSLDIRTPNLYMKAISRYLPDNAVITTDVGQNQVWVAQSMKVKKRQKVFFSGGHGAMGYSLPAAVGCALSSRNMVYSFNGDGGIQMNIQELQTIAREQLPIKIILFNNHSLGMIRHFQEMYFSGNYFQTIPQEGYSVPDFGKIACAYGIKYYLIDSVEKLTESLFLENGPAFIEINITEDTYVFPKLEYGRPNQDQEPLLERSLYKYLMEL